MGNNWEHDYDGCRSGDFIVGRKRDTIFTRSIFGKCWIQRFLQRISADIIVSHERDISGINSNGSCNRLGFRSDHYCFYLYFCIKLASYFLYYIDPAFNPNILRLQIHPVITTLPGRKASVRRSQKSHWANRPYQLEHNWNLRSQRVTGLQIKDRGLQQNHGRRWALNHPTTPLIRIIIQVQLNQNQGNLCRMHLVHYQFELFHIDTWAAQSR